jgi:hypothetical protein
MTTSLSLQDKTWQPPKLRDTDITFGHIPGPFNNLPPMNEIMDAMHDPVFYRYRLFIDNFYLGIAKNIRIEAECDTNDFLRWMQALSANNKISHPVRATGIAMRLREVQASVIWERNNMVRSTNIRENHPALTMERKA